MNAISRSHVELGVRPANISQRARVSHPPILVIIRSRLNKSFICRYVRIPVAVREWAKARVMMSDCKGWAGNIRLRSPESVSRMARNGTSLILAPLDYQSLLPGCTPTVTMATLNSVHFAPSFCHGCPFMDTPTSLIHRITLSPSPGHPACLGPHSFPKIESQLSRSLSSCLFLPLLLGKGRTCLESRYYTSRYILDISL